MSSITPHLSPEQASRLPWPDILALFSLRSVRELERALDLPAGTIARAWSGERGLSSKVYQDLLEGLTAQFSDSPSMRAWMKQHWPPGLLAEAQSALEALYASMDVTQEIPLLGAFPADYIERDEKTELLAALTQERQTQVVWLTGPGGTGKSTLSLSLVRQNWGVLKTHYARVFWVNAEQGDYQDGLRQLADSLEMTGQSPQAIENKLRALTQKSRVLFILDALHEIADLAAWRKLAGTLGKLLVTSRKQLAEIQQQNDGAFRQIIIGNFPREAARQFMQAASNDSQPLEAILDFTEGLPQALRLLKSYQRETRLSLPELWQRLERYRFALLARPGNTQRNENLQICFDFTLEFLEAHHPQAAYLFDCLGIFQENAVLLELLGVVADVRDELTLDDQIAILTRFNLVNLFRDFNYHIVQTHRLMYEYARQRAILQADQRVVERYQDVILAVLQEFSHGLAGSPYYPVRRWLIQDVVYLVEKAVDNPNLAKQMVKNAFNLLLAEGKLEAAEMLIRAQGLENQGYLLSAFYKKQQAQVQSAAGNWQKAQELVRQARDLAWAELQDLRRKTSGIFPWGLEERMNQREAKLYERWGFKDFAEKEFARRLRFYKSRKTQMKFDLTSFAPPDFDRRKDHAQAILELNTALFHNPTLAIEIRAQAGINRADAHILLGEVLQAEQALAELETILAQCKQVKSAPHLFGYFWILKAMTSDLRGDSLTAVQFAHHALENWGYLRFEHERISEDVSSFVHHLYNLSFRQV